MKYAQQLFTKVREKRYPSLLDNSDILAESLEDNISEKGISPELLALWDDVQKEKDNQRENRQAKRDTKKATRRTEFNDHLWDKQWYMVSTTFLFHLFQKNDLVYLNIFFCSQP